MDSTPIIQYDNCDAFNPGTGGGQICDNTPGADGNHSWVRGGRGGT